jgi:lysophospholipase L1-like esterase
MQSPLRFLAFGDSLTAGYCSYGLANHPYSINLKNLFLLSNIPIIVDQKGVSGERVVPSMVGRLETILSNSNNPNYDWVILLGGTNDLGYGTSAEKIFNQGLKPMYDMVLQKSKLAAMTVIQNGVYSPEHIQDEDRQKLNNMIRNYVENYEDQNKICLVDLDKQIQYHSITDLNQRKSIWDDMIHLKPKGYDQMAESIFQQIYKKINQENVFHF